MATPCRVRLNVGGKLFLTTLDTLQSLPHTRLGRLAREDPASTPQQEVELFFDRNPKIINSLLDLYRTGELHIPRNLCAKVVERELEFWGIPVELMRECCFRGFHERVEDVEITAEIDKFLRFPYDTAEERKKLSALGKIWLIMERPTFNLVSKIWSLVFFSMVLLSATLYCFSTIMTFRTVTPTFRDQVARNNMSLQSAYSSLNPIEKYFATTPYPWINLAFNLSFGFFLLEFLVRFLACPDKRFFWRQSRNWLEVVLLFHNGVEVALNKLYTEENLSKAETDALLFFYSLTALKLLRIVYIVRDFKEMKILVLSTQASLKVLTLLALCVLSMSILYGTLLYLAELLTQEYSFHTIPHGMWYAVVTMTTVGYGDVVPMSAVGRVLGMVCAFSGVVTVALPIAEVASNFSKYRDNLASRTHLRRRLAWEEEEGGQGEGEGWNRVCEDGVKGRKESLRLFGKEESGGVVEGRCGEEEEEGEEIRCGGGGGGGVGCLTQTKL